MADNTFDVPVVSVEELSSADPLAEKGGPDEHQSPDAVAEASRAIFPSVADDTLASAQAQIEANVQAAQDQVADAINFAQMGAMEAIQSAQDEVVEPDTQEAAPADEEPEMQEENGGENDIEDQVEPDTEDAPVGEPEEEETPLDDEPEEEETSPGDEPGEDPEENDAEAPTEDEQNGKESEAVELDEEPTTAVVEDVEAKPVNDTTGDVDAYASCELKEAEEDESEMTSTTNGLEIANAASSGQAKNAKSGTGTGDDGESCTADSTSVAPVQVSETGSSWVVEDCRIAARELLAVFLWVAACQLGLVFANGSYIADRIPGYTAFTLWMGVFFGLMMIWETTGLSLGSTLNPSVALAMHVAGVASKHRHAIIVTLFAQLVAHGLGIWATKQFFGSGVSGRLFAAPVPNAVRLGSKRVLTAAAGVEAVATFILCGAVLAMERRLPGAKATKSALTIGVVLLLVGGLSDVTGAVMNPFQAGALAFFEGDWRFHGAYAVGPLLGAVCAGVAHNILYNRVPRGAVRPKTE